ncbi:hypothetical protein RL72_00624 [Microbacterium azadirachtae]|uniref:Uncharacterized protein n=1 Tax=Microbacterium azadirachtae TaxID=582680 RepID=A0A0F0L6H4_9MICO|nr:hypothetical protein RL72_00624 [Microbacterium azadirachtae]
MIRQGADADELLIAYRADIIRNLRENRAKKLDDDSNVSWHVDGLRLRFEGADSRVQISDLFVENANTVGPLSVSDTSGLMSALHCGQGLARLTISVDELRQPHFRQAKVLGSYFI